MALILLKWAILSNFPSQMSTGSSLDDTDSLALMPSGRKSLILAESCKSCGAKMGFAQAGISSLWPALLAQVFLPLQETVQEPDHL